MEHLTFDELLMYAKRTIKVMRDDSGKMKQEYRQLTEKVNKHINNCPECRKMLIKLQETNSMEEIQKLRIEFEHKKLETLSEEERISKQYGINLNSIAHIKLHDGKEYYHFYDIQLNKDVIIRKNNDIKNMSEEFQEVKDGLVKTQNTNAQATGEEAFRYQRIHTNNEVKLYIPDELISNPELLVDLNKEQMKVVSVLLKNKDILRIKEINPETGIAIDDKHKVITSYYNEKTQKYEVNLPKQYQYSVDSVSMTTSEQIQKNNIEVDTTIGNNETIEVANNIPKEIDGIQIDPERVKLYYEYPELLDNQSIISDQEKVSYIKAIENYKKTFENRQNGSSKDKPKVLTYKNPNSISPEEDERQSGFINLLLLSLTTGFAGGIITAIVLGIIR